MQAPDDRTGSHDEAMELQTVLTRYVDSTAGFRQAAQLMPEEHLAAAFHEVSRRREEMVRRVAELIAGDGETPDLEGSSEGWIHRWWIRLRESLPVQDMGSVLSECVRGEKTLLAAMEKALESEELEEQHSALLREAADEVAVTIEHFETAIGD